MSTAAMMFMSTEKHPLNANINNTASMLSNGILPVGTVTMHASSPISSSSALNDKEAAHKRMRKERKPVSKWTEKEDLMMMKLVQKYGTRHWTIIGTKLPGRNGKQCRERYCSKYVLYI
jgi:hypothetical protein